MAGYAQPEVRFAQRSGWFDRLAALLIRELAPTSRKVRTALRMTTIATIGAGLITSCHVENQLGTYIVWLLVGAGPMMSPSKAVAFVIAEGFALAASVVMAGILVETPWLLLPYLFVMMALTTYIGTTLKLGAPVLLIQVVCIDTFYNVSFAPDQIGWAAGGIFGGSVIAFGTLVLFDNWLWPDLGEKILMESMGATIARNRLRLLAAVDYYLDDRGPRPPDPPPTSDLPAQVDLLNRAVVEGVSAHRAAILLAAVTRVTRIGLEIDRLTVTVRQKVSRDVAEMVRPEIQATVDAIATVLDEEAHEMPTHIAVGDDSTPPPSRVRARTAMDDLTARVLQVRPRYIGKVSPAELENFSAFADSLELLTRQIAHLLDEPPQPSAAMPANSEVRSTVLDPVIVRYSLKVGICIVIGYSIGIFSQRPELNTILTTVIITALPTYGAAARKMNLRIVGAAIGGLISLAAIIIVTPNFTSLPAYLIAVFIVFYASAYASLTSGHIAYAGKQIGTTFALVFAGLSPSFDIYEPLWRIWAILLGTVVVAIVAFLLWPEYAGDSLLPRLRKVIRDTLSMLPGGSAANSEDGIQQANSATMRTLAEILEVAEDAQVEGRTSLVNHNAIVESASFLRRIANRLSSIADQRIVNPLPPLDPVSESARTAVLEAIRRHLQSWLDFFSGDNSLDAAAAKAVPLSHSTDDIRGPLELLGSRLEENEFARVASWPLEQRRVILAEVHSMRRIEYLITRLNQWLAQIPGSSASIAPNP